MSTPKRARRPSSYIEPPASKKLMEKPILVNFLRYADLNLEKAYQTAQTAFRLHYFRLYLGLNLAVSVLVWPLDPFYIENSPAIYLMWNILNLVLLITAFTLVSYLKQRFPIQLGIFLFQAYLTVGWAEGSRNSQKYWSSDDFSITGMAFELVMLGPVLAKCSWISSTASALFFNIFLAVRFPSGNNQPRRGFPVCFYVLNALFISLWAFIVERSDRQHFSHQKLTERTTKRFEDLIKEVMPSAVVIAKRGNIIFFNEEASKLLQINSKDELEEKLKDFILEPKHDFANKPTGSKSNTQAGKNNYRELCFNSEGEIISLQDLIALDKFTPINFNEFLTYAGTLKPSDDFDFCENVPKNFDIKIGRLSWEREDAVIIIFTEDVTTERMKFLTEQSLYKDSLLATVSHDLRTPLNGIIGIVEFVLETVGDEDLKKSLNIVLRSSKLLLFMINDILDFSQISHGKLRIQPVSFDIVQTIKEVSKLIKFQAKRKRLSFEFVNKFLPSDNTILFNDPNRLKQIILNLLGNALKFTENGGIKITVGPADKLMETDKRRKSSARVAVQDSGCGIKEEDIPRLFNMFGKLDDPNMRRLNNQGVGLGLAISQNLVRSMNLNMSGEEIKIQSEYGKGSLFYFNLYSMPNEEEGPRKKTLAPFQVFKQANELTFSSLDEGFKAYRVPGFSTKPCMQHEAIVQEDSSKRILLVDDDQINLMVLKVYLKAYPEFKYDLAFNGKQAIESVMERASRGLYYELILMDCNMPVMDGFEATERIMRLVEAQVIPNVIIIALTADASENEMERCLKMGMADYMSKPLSKQDLGKKLNQYMAKPSAEGKTD